MNEEQTQVKSATWCLRLVDGRMAWSNWPLSEVPLVIGRGLGCRMRLEDMRVSRIQCEVRVVDGAPRLLNRSEGSPTRVNGAATHETELKLGDLIEFANHRLIVDCLPEMHKDPEPPSDPPTVQYSKDTPVHRDWIDGVTGGSMSSLASDLLSLFHFSRQLAQAGSLDAVVTEIRNHLAQRLRPDYRWVAWRTRSDGDITLYPPASPEEMEKVPLNAIRLAVSDERGMVAQHNQYSVAIAPLKYGGVTYGALCVQRLMEREYDEQKLHYLLAVAESAAPHIRAAERLEQWQRDVSRDRNARGAANQLLGGSTTMQRLRDLLRQAAGSRGSVLLLGETGTGKELAARTIHAGSNRADGPLIIVNCAAIPADLFESEFFGHEKGSFTGAGQQHRGYFEQAHGGTLFLDEVGDLSPLDQARLLRAVDTGTIRRVGAERNLIVDVRIVSATNRSLSEAAGSDFRLDLYHRLAGIVIEMPALRSRREDIPELAQHFLRACSQDSPAHPVTLAPDAIEQLVAYDWPGNVRELRNVVERACFLASGPVASLSAPLAMHATAAHITTNLTALSLADLERRQLTEVLQQHDGDVAAAAEALGMPKSTLYYRLSKHGVALRGRRAKG